MTKIYAKTAAVPADCGYFTVGKEYETYDPGADGFHIRNDNDQEGYCLWVGCAHLDGGNWTRIEREEPTQ